MSVGFAYISSSDIYFIVSFCADIRSYVGIDIMEFQNQTVSFDLNQLWN